MNRLNRKHLYTLLAVVCIILIGLATLWATNRTTNHTTNHTATDSTIGTNVTNAAPTNTADTNNMNLSNLKPQTRTGTVNKTLEQFSFTDSHGEQYHINDPSQLIDIFAKKQGIDSRFYNLDNVQITGVVSEEGSYGHMGFAKYQLNVTSVE